MKGGKTGNARKIKKQCLNLLYLKSVAKLMLDFSQFLKRICAYSLQVDLTRTFTFRNSKQTYTGIPIIVANMDTVGTFEMAVVMAKVSLDSSFATIWKPLGDCEQSLLVFTYVGEQRGMS